MKDKPETRQPYQNMRHEVLKAIKDCSEAFADCAVEIEITLKFTVRKATP